MGVFKRIYVGKAVRKMTKEKIDDMNKIADSLSSRGDKLMQDFLFEYKSLAHLITSCMSLSTIEEENPDDALKIRRVYIAEYHKEVIQKMLSFIKDKELRLKAKSLFAEHCSYYNKTHYRFLESIAPKVNSAGLKRDIERILRMLNRDYLNSNVAENTIDYAQVAQGAVK